MKMTDKKMQRVYKGVGNERGEIFDFYFRTKYRNPKKLIEIGNNIAQGWGAMCERVRHISDPLEVEINCKSFDDVYDYDNRKFR